MNDYEVIWVPKQLIGDLSRQRYMLFNPYHDKFGRFDVSPKTAAANRFISSRFLGFSRGGVREFVAGRTSHVESAGKSARSVTFKEGMLGRKWSEKRKTAMRAELDRQEEFLKRNLVHGFKADAPITIRSLPFPIGLMIGGSYSPKSHEIMLNKSYVNKLDKGDVVSVNTAIHEQIHSRSVPRWNEEVSGDIFDNRVAVEASTEIISLRLTRQLHGRYRNISGYNTWVKALGNYAMEKSGGDPKKAWQFVRAVNLGNRNDYGGERMFYDRRYVRGRAWKQMIEWDGDIKLFVELEEADELTEEEKFDIMFWQEAMTGNPATAVKEALEINRRDLVIALFELNALYGKFPVLEGVEDEPGRTVLKEGEP
jgi:hypothetical protein